MRENKNIVGAKSIGPKTVNLENKRASFKLLPKRSTRKLVRCHKNPQRDKKRNKRLTIIFGLEKKTKKPKIKINKEIIGGKIMDIGIFSFLFNDNGNNNGFFFPITTTFWRVHFTEFIIYFFETSGF